MDFTNDYYGANQPSGTRIVFVNGSVDPWHALSVLRDLSKTETAIYIPGTAHCANMAGKYSLYCNHEKKQPNYLSPNVQRVIIHLRKSTFIVICIFP